ncbi:hypothetical protein BU26DRAFT_563522 [Trematosphaeria pertusa]|uniref:Uncharacterized protein n=1 Tax=Trematosphaeria pertusa TaxID=390896 RepID=A0A6A6IHD5_9PLEO|nr:uncharacterized protein BU26DRAFT_563522 [Trematosphaeria pertusa]KAF2249619.1 hypothetical protein BU26DRAFT_563522 [Trematosphaeria pertusa]
MLAVSLQEEEEEDDEQGKETDDDETTTYSEPELVRAYRGPTPAPISSRTRSQSRSRSASESRARSVSATRQQPTSRSHSRSRTNTPRSPTPAPSGFRRGRMPNVDVRASTPERQFLSTPTKTQEETYGRQLTAQMRQLTAESIPIRQQASYLRRNSSSNTNSPDRELSSDYVRATADDLTMARLSLHEHALGYASQTISGMHQVIQNQVGRISDHDQRLDQHTRDIVGVDRDVRSQKDRLDRAETESAGLREDVDNHALRIQLLEDLGRRGQGRTVRDV